MREFDQNVGVVGFVLQSGNTVMSERAEMLPSFDRQIDQPGAKQVRSLLCCPLQVLPSTLWCYPQPSDRIYGQWYTYMECCTRIWSDVYVYGITPKCATQDGYSHSNGVVMATHKKVPPTPSTLKVYEP